MASLLYSVAALALCGSASALSPPRSAPGVLSFPVFQERKETPLNKLRRRVDTDVPVINITSTSYLIQLDLGSPAQSVKVAIDTGSSELWVNPNCAAAGSASQEQTCIDHGQYDPTASTNALVSQEVGEITYGKGHVDLQYVQDSITLPGSDVALTDVIFGAGTNSEDLTTGILGLSFGLNYNLGYPSFVDELQAQGVTKARVFGVALGDKDEPGNSGLISFGGVDTKKYNGQLYTAPMLGPQNGEQLFRFWVQLNSVGLTKGSDAKVYSQSAFPVFFDTGATLSYLPTAVVENIVSDLGGAKDSETELYRVPCNMEGSVDFTFGEMTLKVPFDEFVWSLDTDFCVLGADVTDDGSYILGDSFLRAAYVVFDIDTPALHFAPYLNCGSNLQEIPAGANATAKFTGECEIPKDEDKPSAAGRITSVGGAWLAVGALVAVQVGMSLL